MSSATMDLRKCALHRNVRNGFLSIFFLAIFFYFSRQKPLVFTGTHTAIMVGRTFLSSITPKWLEKYRNVIDSAPRPPFFPLHNVWLVPPLSGSARTRATWKIFKIKLKNWNKEEEKKSTRQTYELCISCFSRNKKKRRRKKEKNNDWKAIDDDDVQFWIMDEAHIAFGLFFDKINVVVVVVVVVPAEVEKEPIQFAFQFRAQKDLVLPFLIWIFRGGCGFFLDSAGGPLNSSLISKKFS